MKKILVYKSSGVAVVNYEELEFEYNPLKSATYGQLCLTSDIGFQYESLIKKQHKDPVENVADIVMKLKELEEKVNNNPSLSVIISLRDGNFEIGQLN